MWSFELMVLMQSLTAWICLALSLFITEPPLDHDGTKAPIVDTESKSRKVISLKQIWHLVAKGDPVLRLVFIALPVYNLVTINVPTVPGQYGPIACIVKCTLVCPEYNRCHRNPVWFHTGKEKR
jgi:hypothetical protein